eukprot:TRINITY_DN112025_c0_g1_i1.p1 TRINITY_DN112025_c0_g1~~TRINITY_DN112025_c0_g1_i1.p1  ORF type:complete len:385 (-),score=89.86 TRINITY_DN112025_c0_g1_i1:363-1517(-)
MAPAMAAAQDAVLRLQENRPVTGQHRNLPQGTTHGLVQSPEVKGRPLTNSPASWGGSSRQCSKEISGPRRGAQALGTLLAKKATSASPGLQGLGCTSPQLGSDRTPKRHRSHSGGHFVYDENLNEQHGQSPSSRPTSQQLPRRQTSREEQRPRCLQLDAVALGESAGMREEATPQLFEEVRWVQKQWQPTQKPPAALPFQYRPAPFECSGTPPAASSSSSPSSLELGSDELSTPSNQSLSSCFSAAVGVEHLQLADDSVSADSPSMSHIDNDPNQENQPWRFQENEAATLARSTEGAFSPIAPVLSAGGVRGVLVDVDLQRLPAGTQSDLFVDPTGIHDLILESDSEDVEPAAWSENLAEKLEERIRTNAGGKYSWAVFEDPFP